MVTAGYFMGFFLAQRVNYCLTNFEYSVIEEKFNFQRFWICRQIIGTIRCFHSFENKTIIGKFPIGWKETFVIPSKNRNFEECSLSSKKLRKNYEKMICQHEDSKAILGK